MSPRLGTKAETLERLAPLLTTARVLPQVRFTVGEWQQECSVVLARLRQADWFNQPVIVRSSALGEDNAAESLAGQFTSVPHVMGESAVSEAIDRVVASYESPQAGDQVFLQPQLRNVTVSGVAFSVDPVTGGPYLVVNDQRSADTGEVTGGVACDDELFYWFRDTKLPDEPHLVALIQLMRELESLLKIEALDVEFAWADDTLFLLQVRPLVRVRQVERLSTDCQRCIDEIGTALERRRTAFPQVLGTGIAWGAMPDWNPAEMIGLRPRPLAAGLYRECLTDRIWAEQRRRYGYRDVTGVPLMECFGGQALIDIRASFTSFVPAACSKELARRLVDFSLAELRSRPELHDKVEMELLHHCWTFDLHDKLAKLSERAGFDLAECAILETALRDLTWQIMDPQNGSWADDRRQIAAFDQWLTHQTDSNRPVTPAALRNLLRQCRDTGALAFAGLARVGFVAVKMLNSLVQMRVWTEEDRERFFRSQQTVLSQMHVDRTRLSMSEFLSRYGHLRPGTYDIGVPRYDESPDQYHLQAPMEFVTESCAFQLSDRTAQVTSALLREHHFPMDLDGFLRFLGEAIQFREYGKFVYSRGISELLRMLGDYAATLGLTRDDCSYADQSLWNGTVGDEEFPQRLHQAIAAGRDAVRASQGITLPPLLFSTDELQSFRMPRCQPNYVTHGVGCGAVCELQSVLEETESPPDLRGKVVLLPSADPGYDWIFSTGIVAFVTKFGGANSHMAIRAREWNLPAAIGVGEVRYRRLVQARALRVDCLHQLLVTLP